MHPKVLILFGAGASFGAGGINKLPPLGKDLFNELRKEFPESWGKISEKYIKKFQELTFEEGMGLLVEDAINYIPLQRDMAIYFSRFKIVNPSINLYCKLFNRYIDLILSNNIIISTINYECLIELALSDYGQIRYFGKDPGIDVLKIHGSCNLIRDDISGGGKVELIPTVNLTGGIIRPVPPDQLENILKNKPLCPIMCLYTKSKDIFISPELIKEITSVFQKYIMKSNIVIVIGVKPNPNDHHLWDYIKKTNGDLKLITNKDECEKWIRKYRKNKPVEWLSNRFDTGFDRICNIIDEEFNRGNESQAITYSFSFQ